MYLTFWEKPMYELNQRVIAIIDGNEKVATIVGRTFQDNPRYDVMLSDGSHYIETNLSSKMIKDLDI
tara:strand:- start:222 stop:422 length:201 start_codon:yes stop_codon:yes gene_type:complete